MKILFSVNEYDQDGDLNEYGIYLHFEGTRIKVADNIDEFDEVIEQLKKMRQEILENL